MKPALVLSTVAVAAILAAAASAQDLVIEHARIIDGTGRVVENGSISVRNGRIAEVGGGIESSGAARVIDARGRSVLPGLIDTHRHVIGGGPIDDAAALARWLDEQAPARMREFLRSGFTTILSAGDPTAGIVELKRRLQASQIAGPRLLVSGSRIRPASSEEVEACRNDEFCRLNESLYDDVGEARAVVGRLAAAGVDAVKIRLDPSDPTGLDAETAAAVASEAERLGIPSIAHAAQVQNMIAAVEAGVTRLVHTPHTGTLLGTRGAELVVDRGIPVSSTLGVWVPLFGAENELRWRNGAPFPPPGVARAGQGPVNARYLWDAGAMIAFGTDTGFHPAASLAHELRPLSLLFAPEDVVTMITRNAAAWLGLEDEIGTLEPGKVADIVVVDGNPLEDAGALTRVTTVIKNGSIVVVNGR